MASRYEDYKERGDINTYLTGIAYNLKIHVAPDADANEDANEEQ